MINGIMFMIGLLLTIIARLNYFIYDKEDQKNLITIALVLDVLGSAIMVYSLRR